MTALDPATLARAQALFALGAQLHADKRLDGTQALATFEQARQLAPSSPEILNALGAVLSRMGRDEEAIRYFQQALVHQPRHADALENLAGLLHRTQRYELAAAHLQSWLQNTTKQPELAPYVMGRLAYTRRLMADWRDDDAQTQALRQALHAGQQAAFPFEFLSFSDDPAEHLKSARTLVAHRHPSAPQPLWQGQRWTHQRIKVAYVSNDFCNHATAVLLAQVLALHDKSRFEVFALSWSPLQDAMYERIRHSVEHFVDIRHQSDQQVAQWLHDQQIDICVDIKGFASHYRLGIFAYRPCPIQVSYLGYPGSSGAPYMDYLIADAHVIAPEDSAHYSEHLVRLPHSYQANDPTREVALPPANRQVLGLPARGSGTQGFVFACFNNSYKITPEVFAQWMQILQATPGSVLWLLDANDWVKQSLRQHARSHGVDEARLLFAPRVPTPEHLARHVGADLFLDTFPVNAHTTAADALWMGLPVLSRYGRSFSSRVAYSLLHACQVPGGAPLVQELAVNQPDVYVQRAIALAQDPARLQRLKDHLQTQRDHLPLFDAALTCHHLQAAYSAMWQRWQEGLAPAAMNIPATEPIRSAQTALTKPETTDLAQATASHLQTLSLGLLPSGPAQLALAVFDAALKARAQESALWRARAHTALRLPEASYRAQGLADLQRAHQLDPTHERLRFELALTLEQSGDVAAACQHLAHLEKQAPQDSQYPLKHVRCLRSMGQLDAALQVSQQWTQRQPAVAQAWTQQASAYWALQQPAPAMTSIAQALQLEPDAADALNLRGLLGRDKGLPTNQALADFEHAHRLEPGNPYYLSNIAITLDELGRLQAALPWWQRLLALPGPHPADVLLLQAHGAEQLGKTPQAMDLFLKAAQAEPDNFDAWLQYGHSCTSLGRDQEAKDAYVQAVRIAPDNVHALSALMRAERCVGDWQHHTPRLAQVLHAAEHSDVPVNPFLMTIVSDDPALQLRVGELESAQIGQNITPIPWPPASQAPRPAGQRLRIGYFSADLHDHATSYLMAQMLESHDRQRFEVFAYSFGPDAKDHAYRQRLVRGIEHFHQVHHLGARQIAELARTHGIDIAVDLKGHTRQGRPQIFAWRAAPLQVSYIGFPGTLGSPWMDYVVADTHVIQAEDLAHYSEKVVRLPGCYQANDTQRAVASPGFSRATAGLPADALVLCCFNSTFKISPDVFDTWLGLLHDLPKAVLWLFDKNRQVQDTLRQVAHARGIAPERLIFASYAPLPMHLSRYRLADLFLDTAPYNAHTTASDALWVGLPVLTLSGRSFASRVGASLLNTLGLPELITHDLAEYRAKALALCQHPEQLAALRQQVMNSPHRAELFDGQRLAQRMEAAYLRMDERQQQGLPAESFDV
ncbi:tetratricopeptide repeat protein [Limnohabitans sp. T6-5]|uniref:O-linked N-acetylglucosamine transferase family protein n=1 Tax=Limnohabitans sp. T6-5 TaxID=1100724 RepID=UPI0013049103|nr:tetratricopeptide repeat protein [Limnohabitans sp. T6-5]